VIGELVAKKRTTLVEAVYAMMKGAKENVE